MARQRAPALPVSLAILAVLALLPAAGCDGEDGSRCGPSRGVVERVVDGDTVVLADGTKVRYLDVDTPESTNTTECWGPEAAAYNESLVLGREVRLEYDEECTDRYGRLLAHVFVDGRNVGLEEVLQGYGCAMILEPNVAGRQAFEEAQQIANAYGRGVWQWEPGGCDQPWPCPM